MFRSTKTIFFSVIFFIDIVKVFCETDNLDNKPLLSLEVLPGAKGKLELTIQNPDSVAPFLPDQSKRSTDQISCTLLGGGLDSNSKVTLMYVSDSVSTGSSPVHYTITQAKFKIKVEPQGNVQCSTNMTDHGLITSEVKLYRNEECQSFSMQVHYDCTDAPCKNATTLAEDLEKYFKPEFSNIRIIPVQTIQTKLFLRCEIHNIFSIKDSSAKLTQKDRSVAEEINRLSIINKAEAYTSIDGLKIVNIRNTRICQADSDSALSWPETRLGSTASPEQLCENVTRKCVGNFIVGATWEPLYESDKKCHVSAQKTRVLFELSTNSEQEIEKTLMEVEKQLEPTAKQENQNKEVSLIETDVKSIANTLKNVALHALGDIGLNSVCTITNKLMEIEQINSNTRILKTCQEKFNSSNNILDSLDKILNNVELQKKDRLIVTKRFVTYIADLSGRQKGIVGLAVLRKNGQESDYFKNEDVVLLNRNTTLGSLLSMDVKAAVMLPPSLHDMGSRLVINLFYDDSLFGSRELLGEGRHALSVTLDGKRYEELKQPLVLLFRRPAGGSNTLPRSYRGKNVNSPCVFWDFQTNSGTGDWSSVGCTLADPPNHSAAVNVDICVCTHLTHFAELLREFPESSLVNHFALDVITITGCLLSLLGLLGIATTAVVFPEWRRGASKKIQLNLCLALGLLMISFLIGSFTKHSAEVDGMMLRVSCMGSGIVLHYSILASFCWMVVAAWGQYLRLTKPLESLSRKPHYVLKSCLFAWGLPVIPLIAILAMNQDVYNPPNCYPSGYYLYFSVAMPVILAVSLNATIFIYILLSIFQCCGLGIRLVHLRNNQRTRSIALRKLATAVFLFLLLGLSWIFGILNWSYIFCLTASMQGFAVFVFFVVLDKTTRAKWNKKMGGEKQEELRIHSQSSSADFIRRWSSRNRYPQHYVMSQISTISD